MSERLQTLKYTMTVEGETEQWYFQWLRDQIKGKTLKMLLARLSP